VAVKHSCAGSVRCSDFVKSVLFLSDILECPSAMSTCRLFTESVYTKLVDWVKSALWLVTDPHDRCDIKSEQRPDLT